MVHTVTEDTPTQTLNVCTTVRLLSQDNECANVKTRATTKGIRKQITKMSDVRTTWYNSQIVEILGGVEVSQHVSLTGVGAVVSVVTSIVEGRQGNT